MDVRKCIFTGKDAKAKARVVPKEHLNEDEYHNWSNQVPCDLEYLEIKKDRLPNELEMQANEYFHLLELARLRVTFYESKLKEIQAVLSKQEPKPRNPDRKNNKDIQIENEIKANSLTKTLDKDIMETLKQQTKDFWEGEDG